MRYLKMSLVLLIGLIGTGFYFGSKPSINPDDFLTITAESGDVNTFDDVTLNGFYEDDKMFYSNKDGNWLQGQLSYIQQLDLPSSPDLIQLKNKYPDFFNAIQFNQDYNIGAQFIETPDYVVAANFTSQESSNDLIYGAISYDNFHVDILDKKTQETNSYDYKREPLASAYYTEIMGIYLDGDNLQVLFNETGDEDSVLKEASFNLKTQNYTEDTVMTSESPYAFQSYRYAYGFPFGLSNNNRYALLSVDESDVDSDLNTENYYDIYVDLASKKMQKLPADDIAYFVTANDQLFGLTLNENGYQLLTYHSDTLEVTDTTNLQVDDNSKVLKTGGGSIASVMNEAESPVFYFVNDKLYVTVEYMDDSPIDYAVFSTKTGEQLANGQLLSKNSNNNKPIKISINDIHSSAQ